MNDYASVLIVDDEPNNFDVIEALLEGEPYKLYYAANASRALRWLEKNSVDVILLDVMMPEIDGITFCSYLKNNPNYQYIPIIMVTALTGKEDLARCLEAGADDFISKPLNWIELRSRLHSMLRIKQQYDHLQLLLQRREEMAEIIVHDLQNPVTSIVLSCEMLKFTNLDQRQSKKVEQISIAGRRLEEQIQTLLTMAKLETGRLILNPISTALKPFLEKLVKEFNAIAAAKSITITLEIEADNDQAAVDSHLFSRIINNLLSNALKYSPRGKEIQVKLLDTTETIILKVIDQGKGVSDQFKEKIFKKYETGTQHSDVNQTGLGLAFCQMAILAHGGKIYVKDNQPQGAIFTVEIPREVNSESG
ncbi:MAG: response regulator [Cyanobacteria bacterium]|jgi:signal transduction histidine kinase|nr:response regulator [Cyanobacteria bacterium GSL.Bin21]